MKNTLLLFTLFLIFGCNEKETRSPDLNKNAKYPYPEEVYAGMFEEIQMMNLYPDSKTFADAIPKADPKEIILEFRKRKNDSDFDGKAFVEEFWNLPKPYSSGFTTDSTKTLTEHINSLWPILTRSADIAQSGSTLIPLPHPYIVSGGQNSEVYYWDSYFTMLGLKESGNEDLIKNMLDNFVFLINEIGHIPNGNRSYFISRSQPPFFAQMVDLYASVKGDQVYMEYLSAMQKEYDFWIRGDFHVNQENTKHEHSVFLDEGKIINRYYDSHDAPRQENYLDDRNMGVHRNLRAACESGWDFSSRWLANPKYLGTIRTESIFPIDLNALLYGLENILEKSYRIADNKSKADEYKASQENRIVLMNDYQWVDSTGVFLDYNFQWEKRMNRNTAAMMYPLYFKMTSQEQADKVMKYVMKELMKPGGIVTTTEETGQEWDAPYGWAPLQWIALRGMDNYGYQKEAKDLAQRWTTLNENVYKNTGKMLEKYNVEDLDLADGGGKYPEQDGFGWSNGVYLAMKAYLKN